MDRTTLKSWFQRGKKPTASQFAALIDSFWHKDDTMSLHSIKGLNEALQTKAGINHDHDEEYSAIGHAHDQYLTEHQDISNKADKAVNAIAGNLAALDANGNPIDSSKKTTDFAPAEHNHDEVYSAIGHAHDQYLTEHQDISNKADKAVNAIAGNLAALDANGNPIDSGKKTTDFAPAEHNHDEEYSAIGHTHDQYLTEHQDISGKQDKTDHSLLTTAKTIVGAINELWEKVEDMWEKYIRGIDKVTHAELVAMRDAGELIAGRRYRIIDFVTTTSQPDTRSAGHRFDIIVMADSSSTLNENATAIKHKFTEEELVVPTYFLWRSDNDADYGIITKVRVPQSLDDIVGRYTNDGEEYISNKMLGNYTELSSANEDEMLLKWLYTNEDDPNDTESGTDTYSFVSEITFDETDDPNYFADSKLNAWQLKYCLDNDITRYLYTDPEKGKGVIYYLEDEFGNKGDFDFKNIQHKRYKVTDDSADGILSLLDGQYVGFNADMQDLIIEDDSDYIWAFSASMPSYSLDEDTEELNLDMTNQLDATLNRLPEGTGIDADGGGYAHPVIFCKNNRFVTHQISMSLDDGTWVYPYRVSNIVLFCYPKYFSGDDVIPARVEFENCSDNVLASDSDFITANSMFSRNTFLTANSNLIFGRSVGRTIFKGDCYRCTFGGYIDYVTFGGYIYGSTFGGDIRNTTFGGYIYGSTFGGNLSNGHIHGYLYHFTIGKEGETWTNLVINPGVEYLTVTCSDTSEGEIKNVYIYGGVCGTESETLTVIIPTRNNSLVEIKSTSKEEILV